MSTLGWQCSICTYHHQAPGTRCVMCGELRVSKEDMSNFILGKPIPPEHTTNSSTTTTIANPPTRESTSTTSSNKPSAVSTGKKTPFSVAAVAKSKTDRVPPSIGNRTLPYKPGPVPYDPETAKTWIYPSSDVYEKRKYQFEISETALLQNTLVSLPTGLGKTLIAAVVLYNYYRWFPTGKVLFLAPTVPLVDQQITACYEIMGIPAHHTAILTGKVPAKQRIEIYKTRRVFFCTPQTIQKDLENNRINDPQSIVCVVLDEAHKAVGDYAYCKVVEQLETAQAKFRLLGLSATPGTSIKAIQQVIYTLRINCIEARTDNDVQQYTHDRHSEIVIVKQVSAIREIQRLLDEILQPILDRLRKANALNMVGNATVTPYCLIRARKAYEERQEYDSSNIGYFMAAMTFAQQRSDLHRHGLGVVRNKLLNLKSSRPRGIMATIVRSTKFDELCNEMEKASSTADATGNQIHDRLKNNPKLESLRNILTEHFERRKACNTLGSTRAIVFSQFRDSVCEIEAALQDLDLIRPRHFVGQGKGTDKMKGMKQEEQKRVIQEFRDGNHNVLVCTCIGEEGLDIGEVDLIVNFDCLSSPIRMIQRVGRTGRKRNGRVVTLVSEGAEERTLAKSKQNERNLVHALRNPRSFTVTPSAPTFPQPPLVEERDMRVSNNFHMSQVDGAKKMNRKLPSRDISSTYRRKWKLGTKDMRLVAQLLGPWKTLQMENSQSDSSTLWPRQLRKRLLVGRAIAVSTEKRSALYSFGPVTLMLRRFENGLTLNKLQHGNKGGALEQMFPLDDKQVEPKHRTERRTSTIERVATLGDNLGEGSQIKAKDPPNPSSTREMTNPYLKFATRAQLANSTSNVGFLPSTTKKPYSERTNSTAGTSDNLPTVQDDGFAFKENQKRRNPYPQGSSCPREDLSKQNAFVCEESLNANSIGTENDNFMSIANLPCELDEFKLPSQDDSSGRPQVELDEFRLPSQDSSECGRFEDDDVVERLEAVRIQNICSLNQNIGDRNGFVLPTQESSSEEGSVTNNNKRNLASTAANSAAIGNNESSYPVTKLDQTSKSERDTQCTSVEEESPQTQEIVPTKRRKVLAIEDTPDSTASIHTGFGKSTMNASDVLLQLRSSAPTSFCAELKPGTPRTQEASRLLEDTPSYNEDVQNTVCSPKNSQHCSEPDTDTIVCAVCSSNRVLDEDPLVLCDGREGRCGLAVHATCYSAKISATANKWYCDSCAFRREGKDTKTILCSFCGASKGALKLLLSDSWECIHCLRKTKGLPTSRPTHMQLADYDTVIDGSADKLALKRRREQAMEKYISKEAEVASDVSEDDDSDILRTIEEEEAGNAFINDSSQLGYTQDEIDAVEKESEFVNEGQLAFDAERERLCRFETPLMNRRMKSSRRTFSASQGSERSDRGLGNMHFIRSVLEHHRQGGNSAEIEAVFQELEAGRSDFEKQKS